MVRNAGWLGGLWSRQAMEPTDQAEPLIAAQVFCRRTVRDLCRRRVVQLYKSLYSCTTEGLGLIRVEGAAAAAAVIDSGQEPLLRAAAALFREHGVAGTSMRAIAAEAGMLLGSVTYRYATKESLVLALMRNSVARVTGDVTAAVAGSTDPIQRLRLALRAHVRVLVSDDAAYVLMFEWWRLSEPTRAELSRQRRGYEAVWDDLIHAAAASGQLATGLDLPLVRKFAFGAANSVAFWYRPDGHLSPEQIADAFSDYIGLGTLASDYRRASADKGDLP